MTENTENKITVAALTAGLNTPSSRFRIRQYTARLADHGIIVKEHIPFFEKSCGLPSPFKAAARIPALWRTRDADLIWLGKELVQGYETFERFLKRPRVMDVDDAVWLNLPFGKFAAPRIAKAMDAVIAGNNYLAEYFAQFCNDVHIVPTAVDLERYQPKPAAAEPSGKFVIGWTGLASNYKYLRQIEPALNKFFTDCKDAQLSILADKPYKPGHISPWRITFKKWTKRNEASALHDFSVGIMPLADDPWTRGKCSFKMLQYMAVGLPVIVSPVGMNNDILEKGNIGFAADADEQWYDALKTLHDNPALQLDMGQQGRKVVEDFYSAEKIAGDLARIFRTLAGK